MMSKNLLMDEIRELGKEYKKKPYKMNTDFHIRYKTKVEHDKLFATFTSLKIPSYIDAFYLCDFDVDKLHDFMNPDFPSAFQDTETQVNYSGDGRHAIFKIDTSAEMYGEYDIFQTVLTLVADSIKRLMGNKKYTLTVEEVK